MREIAGAFFVAKALLENQSVRGYAWDDDKGYSRNLQGKKRLSRR